MKRLISMAAAASLALGGIALVGCESNNQSDLPQNERGATAGGNGQFGESPARPGSYQDQSNNNNSAAPTTQPSSGYYGH